MLLHNGFLSDNSFRFDGRIPMYYELKLAFLVYLWYPKTRVCGNTSVQQPKKYVAVAITSTCN
jgi:hypothetical protein